jgi:hypothetical protein
MKHLTLSLLFSALLALTSQAAQIGDTVESKVSLGDRIDIPRNVVVAITSVDLEDGVWAVSGSAQVFEGYLNQSAIVGGSLNDEIALTVDGTQTFLSVLAGQYFVGAPMSSRTIEVNGSATIYLLVYNQSAQTTLRPQAWGFISARKIRNNH